MNTEADHNSKTCELRKGVWRMVVIDGVWTAIELTWCEGCRCFIYPKIEGWKRRHEIFDVHTV